MGLWKTRGGFLCLDGGKGNSRTFFLLIPGCFKHSHAIAIGRRLWQARDWQDASAEAVHVWEIEDQGRCDEGYEDGTDFEEGADCEGEAVGGWEKEERFGKWMRSYPHCAFASGEHWSFG